MNQELKPCPFCGGNSAFNEHDAECYFTVLKNVKAAPRGDISGMIDLLAAWNRRHEAQQPAGDVFSDTQLLDAMQKRRIAVIPEFEGPWDATIYGDDSEPIATASGDTPRAAIAAATASDSARKAGGE